MTEQDIIDTIRQYKYIPEKLLFKLFCNGCYDYVNDKNAKYLQRTLKRLTGEKKIEYHSDRNAYCVPLFSEERLNTTLTGTHIVFLFFLRR